MNNKFSQYHRCGKGDAKTNAARNESNIDVNNK